MQKNHLPLVILDRAPNQDSYSVIRAKNYEGAQLAVRHLLDIGCKRIAHIYGPQEMITAKERLRGYEDAVRDMPWYSPSMMVAGNFRIDGGINAIEALLLRHPDVDGIFAGNDLMAVGALKALHRLGKKVPDDVAICGFDGIALTEITEPEITTIAQPIYEMGALAATVLLEKITAKEQTNPVHELDVTLIPRGSTKRS
jgi:LacI family transcriptional regulator